MSDLKTKLTELQNIVREIDEIDAGVGAIMWDSFGLGINSMQAVVKAGGTADLDLSERISMVSNILGLDIEELVKFIIERDFMSQEAQDIMSKAADEETLSFITSDEDIDDYEKFIEENKVKENLDFLKGEL